MVPHDPAAAAVPARVGASRSDGAASDPLEVLVRSDKWQLGAGDGGLFAPPFPLWLDAPGFWDDGTIYHYPIGPLFTVAVLGADGHVIPLKLVSRRWTPAELTCEYRLSGGLTATEIRTVQPGGVFASEWRVHAPRPASLHLIAWTAQPATDVDLSAVAWNGALTFTRTVRDDTGSEFKVAAELTCVGEATSWAASVSDATPARPEWRLTPFAEQWMGGRLTSDVRAGRAEPGSMLYAAVHRALDASTGDSTQTFAIRVSAADPALRVLAGAARPDGAGMLGRTAAASSIRRPNIAPGTPSLAAASRRRWYDVFDAVPQLTCSDPYFEACYWYRWYGLALHGLAPGTGNFQHATLCEGVDTARRPSATAVPCHVRELRWVNAELCRSLIRTFFAHQREDGSLPRHIHVDRVDPADSDDADWGGAFDALNAVAPDAAFAAEMYFRLARYADWLIRTRDAESSGLFGADRSGAVGGRGGRYPLLGPAAAPPPSRDRSRGATPEPAAKSVEITVYAYRLLRVLERFATQSGQRAESARWGGAADRTRRAVRDRMWSIDLATFCDLDPRTGNVVGGRTDRGFLPFVTDLASDDHRHGLERTLLDPEKFWTPFPVPSLAAADPRFDATGASDGARRARPSNGRVWPMTNSVVLEALGAVDEGRAPRFREAAAHLLRRSVRMMFFDGDVSRPNAFEHYNPLTGAPSLFRGRDDHQHAWFNDLIIRYVAGIRLQSGGVVVDPLPLALDRVHLAGVVVAGHRLDVSIEGDRYAVTFDGTSHHGRLGTPTELSP